MLLNEIVEHTGAHAAQINIDIENVVAFDDGDNFDELPKAFRTDLINYVKEFLLGKRDKELNTTRWNIYFNLSLTIQVVDFD